MSVLFPLVSAQQAHSVQVWFSISIYRSIFRQLCQLFYPRIPLEEFLCIIAWVYSEIFYSSVNPVLTVYLFLLNLCATLYYNYKFVMGKKLVMEQFVSVSYLNFSTKLRQIYF